jgi:hypothetical protein
MRQNLITLLLLIGALLIILSGCIEKMKWTCSNHNPPHTTTRLSELRELTKEHGCQGWYAEPYREEK